MRQIYKAAAHNHENEEQIEKNIFKYFEIFLERTGGSCGLDNTGNLMSESSFQAVTATVIIIIRIDILGRKHLEMLNVIILLTQ